MLKNYFKIAFRNFKRNKIHSGINLLSLCIGITCGMFIYTYVKHELSYDRFFTHADQIYRLENTSGFTGKSKSRYAFLNKHSSPGAYQSIPAIDNQTRFTELRDVYARANNKKITETNFWSADSSFFSLFDFPLLEGSRKSLLQQHHSIVLTQNIAQKYFGNQKALGNRFTLIYKDKTVPLTVAGVVKVPSNTHLQFDAIVSEDVYQDLYPYGFDDVYTYNYLRLTKGAQLAKVEQQLDKMYDKPDYQFIDYQLRPLTDIHLHSHVTGEIIPNSDIRYIYFLSIIGVILLIIAGINFTSLATAQALRRYKEAGIRKVLGARRGQLIGQILAEAILLALIALGAGYIVIYMTVPFFNHLVGRSFVFADFLNVPMILLFTGIALIIGILAGCYPALLLSSFQPIKTLKEISPSGKKGTTIWKSIVIVQFAASIAMVICTVTIYRQLQYIQNKDLGFDKDRILTVQNVNNNQYDLLRTHLNSIPGIKNVSISRFVPGIRKTGGTTLAKIPSRPDSLMINWNSVGYNFFNTYGIKLKEGRMFSNEYATDSTQAFIVNEAAVKTFGLKNPIGKKIKFFGIPPRKIIGVTENLNFFSLYQHYAPMVFLIDPGQFYILSVKIGPTSDISNTVSQIKNAWETVLPNTPFEYKFVDNQFDALYKNDQQMGKIFALFAGLALLIACLGLFSLSSYMAAKRRKEIGIRKMLGATIPNILLSFYKNYVFLVAVASLIAVPLSYLFLHNWLQKFAFRIAMPIWAFCLAIVTTLIIALTTVSYESVKAATANTVDTLDNE